MKHTSFKELSREHSTWGRQFQDADAKANFHKTTDNDLALILGCLMRIADAIEGIAGPYAQKAFAQWEQMFEQAWYRKWVDQINELEAVHGGCPNKLRSYLAGKFREMSYPNNMNFDPTAEPDIFWSSIKAPPKYHPLFSEYRRWMKRKVKKQTEAPEMKGEMTNGEAKG